ncbi:btb poz domain protein btb2 [Moniliophthora roreri]|nr:btb poz domain protein btb2 [Moniliophthora roreri]
MHPNGDHSLLNGVKSHEGPAPSGSLSSDTRPDFDNQRTNGASYSYQNLNRDQHYDQKIIDHLYESGFQRGEYADTILHVHQNVYRLHALLLSRTADVHFTTSCWASHHICFDRARARDHAGALGYLYSSISLNLIRPDNARAALAAGCLLGGMDNLCEYAYETCRRSISVDTIDSWLEFTESLSSSNGENTPDVSRTRIFGPYAQRLRDDIFHFLVVTLPEVLEISSPNGPPQGTSNREVLLQIFSRVPFDMFKEAVESPSFQIGSDQSRFKFAKDAIEIRKRGIARGPGCEETVVLAFGGGYSGGSAVHVTRKMRKRQLWKVNS